MTHAELLKTKTRPAFLLPAGAATCAGELAEVLSRPDRFLDEAGMMADRTITVWRCKFCLAQIVTDESGRIHNHYQSVPIPIRAIAEDTAAR